MSLWSLSSRAENAARSLIRVPVHFLEPAHWVHVPLVPLLSRGKRRAFLGCSQSEPATGRAPPVHEGAGLPDRWTGRGPAPAGMECPGGPQPEGG